MSTYFMIYVLRIQTTSIITFFQPRFSLNSPHHPSFTPTCLVNEIDIPIKFFPFAGNTRELPSTMFLFGFPLLPSRIYKIHNILIKLNLFPTKSYKMNNRIWNWIEILNIVLLCFLLLSLHYSGYIIYDYNLMAAN